MIKTRIWVIGIVLVLVLSLLAVLLRPQNGANMTAEIFLDGELIRTIDLSAVREPYSFTVEGANGSNTVSVEPGRICVSEADCPDRICVQQGWQSAGETPIVCLPHRLVIQLVPTGPVQTGELAVDGVIQ
ncbi:MAG: NusG domain II-containing protein [Eubacteriales bacterium]